MNIIEAIKKAMEEDKEIALPTDKHCANNGYHLRAKPSLFNLCVKEYYGELRTIHQFPLNPNEILRDDWMVI